MSIYKRIVLSILTMAILPLASYASLRSYLETNDALVTWDADVFPIPFSIYIGDARIKDKEDKVRAVIRAFKSWEYLSQSLISFHYAGLTDISEPAYDGVNAVLWITENWRHNPEQMAYTTLWVTRDGRILDADIELNAEHFQWSTNGERHLMDLQNVLVHEVGHFLGLDHSIDSIEASMFPIIPFGEVRKRVVKPGDMESASFMYPVRSRNIGVVNLPSPEFLGELIPSTTIRTNYPDILKVGKLSLATGMRLDTDGTSGIAAIIRDDGSDILYLYPKPGDPLESLEWKARDAWEIPRGNIKGLTAIDIDGDGADEIAVIRLNDISEHMLYIYDSPMKNPSPDENMRTWVARDLWRIPGNSDNIIFLSLDFDGDGRKEIATLTYSPEGIYLLNVFTPPQRYDTSREDAVMRGAPVTIPFILSGIIVDADAVDVNGDGVSELAVLIKNGNGSYEVQLLSLSAPSFPGEVQQPVPVASMPLAEIPGEKPGNITFLEGNDLDTPLLIVIVEEAGIPGILE